MPIAWSSEPPAKEVSTKILRLKPGETVELLILAKPQRANLHWVDGNSQLCVGPGCVWCPMRSYPRWYCPGLAYGKNWYEIEQATGTAKCVKVVGELSEESMTKIDGREFCGLKVELSRGKAPRSPVVLRICDDQPKRKPECNWSIEPILERIWGLNKRRMAKSTDRATILQHPAARPA